MKYTDIDNETRAIDTRHINMKDLIISRTDSTAVTIANSLNSLYEYYRMQGINDRTAMGEIAKSISKALAAILITSPFHYEEREQFVSHLIAEDTKEYIETIMRSNCIGD